MPRNFALVRERAKKRRIVELADRITQYALQIEGESDYNTETHAWAEQIYELGYKIKDRAEGVDQEGYG